MILHSLKVAVLFFVLACFLLAFPHANAQEQSPAPTQDQPTHATGQGQTNPEAQHRVRHLPTLEEQLKMLTERLTLDATQQGMVKVILERRQSELLDVYKNSSLSAVDRFHAIKAVHDRAYDRIGKVLNDEQSKKFELMRPHETPLPHPDSQTITTPRNPTN